MRPQSQLMVNRRRRRLSCCRSWLTWPGYGVQVCLSCRPPQQPLACLAMRTGLSWYLLPAYALHHTQGQYQFQGCERDVTLLPRPCHRLRPLRRTRQPSSSRPSQHCLSHADPERREILHLQGRSPRLAQLSVRTPSCLSSVVGPEVGTCQGILGRRCHGSLQPDLKT